MAIGTAPDFSYALESPWAELFIKDSDIVTPRVAFGERFGGDKVLEVYGEVGRRFAVDASTNLLHWTALETNVIVFNPTTFGIPPFWPEAMRFYRSRFLER